MLHQKEDKSQESIFGQIKGIFGAGLANLAKYAKQEDVADDNRDLAATFNQDTFRKIDPAD